VLCPSALSREAPWHLALANLPYPWKTLCSGFSMENRCRKSFGAFATTGQQRSGTSKRKRESNLHQKTRREA